MTSHSLACPVNQEQATAEHKHESPTQLIHSRTSCEPDTLPTHVFIPWSIFSLVGLVGHSFAKRSSSLIYKNEIKLNPYYRQTYFYL